MRADITSTHIEINLRKSFCSKGANGEKDITLSLYILSRSPDV